MTHNPALNGEIADRTESGDRWNSNILEIPKRKARNILANPTFRSPFLLLILSKIPRINASALTLIRNK